MLALNPVSPSRPAPPPLAASCCLHCGNVLPRDARDGFCCAGCKTVHGLIENAGLSRYYDLRETAIVPPAFLSATAKSDRNWLEPLAARLAHSNTSLELPIKLQGLRCAGCVWLIQQLFKQHPGAQRISINSARGSARLCVEPSFPLGAFVDALSRFGYLAGDIGDSERADDGLLLRTGVCLALSANAMMFSAAIYLGLHEGPLYKLLHGLNFACATLAVLVGAPTFISSAYRALQQRILHLDLPIAAGIALSYAAALWSFISGHSAAAYYDSLATFIALMLLGRWLKERIVERNRRELLTNSGLDGLLVRCVRGAKVELVPATELKAGDSLLIPPGDLVPVAGVLQGANAQCSLDWINGESEPSEYTQGSAIPAGAFNAGSTPLTLICQTDFASSQLVELIGQDPQHKAPDSRRTHTFSLLYVATVLVTGAAAFAYWALTTGSVTRGLEVATAIYVVTCPCAIGIAVPLAEELVLAGLRRVGLFVRTPSFLDRALAVRRVVFDKTGTLTTGRLHVLDVSPLGQLDAAARDVLYSMAVASGHPKSSAVAQALEALAPTLRTDLLVHETAGQGTEARSGGHVYRLGQASWAAGDHAASSGSEDLIFSKDGAALCRLRTGETLRDDARCEIAALTRDGYETFILSGDASARVRGLAIQLGVPTERSLGKQSPQDKAAFIAQHDKQDMLMIGDGVNDSLAVAQAFTSGTPSIDRAVMPSRTDFYFVTPGLAPIRVALRAARKLSTVLRRNQIFAVTYNVAVVSLALLGFMKPWLAAVLMPLSSIVVLTTTSWSLASRSSLWKS